MFFPPESSWQKHDVPFMFLQYDFNLCACVCVCVLFYLPDSLYLEGSDVYPKSGSDTKK